MKKILSMMFVFALLFSLVACGGEKTSSGGSGKLETSSKTDRWPSGVYDALGIPEYKAGMLIYSTPDDVAGGVYFDTTREELIAYIDGLKEKGFHMSENYYERLKTRSWESFEVYLPNPGGKYSLSCIYSWENDGKGIDQEIYDEKSGKEFTINYNVSFSLFEHGTPNGWNKTDLLASVGLPDSKIKIENADKIIKEVENEKSLIAAALANNLKCAVIEINFAFDYNLTNEFLVEYENRLVEACKEIADDGKLYAWLDELDMEKVKTSGCGYWTYTYQGTKYSVQIFAETGYEEEIAIVVQEVK